MTRIGRWCLAYLGTIFVLVFVLFAGIWAWDGFVGEPWAVFLAPVVYTLPIGLFLLLPAVAVDWALASSSFDSVVIYAVAGACLVLSALIGLGLYDGLGLPSTDQWSGILALAILGGIGGALFRAFKGQRQ